MKLKEQAIRAALVVLAASSIIWSCSSPLLDTTAETVDGIAANKGVLSFTLTGVVSTSAARTIVPAAGDWPAIASFDVTLSRAGYTDIIATFTEMTGSVSGLEAGEWTVIVNGKTAGGNIVATGSTTVTIAAPGPTTASVSLAYIAAAAGNSGSLSITLVFPKTELITAGTSGVVATLDGVAISPALEVSDNGDGANDKVVCAVSGITSASPLLRISLKKGAVVVLSWAERVWVYSNITTTKTDTLASSAFSAPPPAPASLTATLQADGTVALSWTHVSTAETYSIDRSADEGGNWTSIGVALAAGTTSSTNSLAILEESYRYRISATNIYGTSAACISSTDVAITPVFIVAYDKAELEVGYQTGDTATTITQDVSLSTTASTTTTISWVSSNSAITTNGTVMRPAFPTGDQSGDLTATITNNGSSDTKVFAGLKVLKMPQTDAEAVADGKANLAIGYGVPDTADSVTVNLTNLPDSSTSGTTVAWTTNDPAHVTAAGVVTRPVYGSGDATATLTATITKGGASDTRTFTLTVKELPDPDIAAVDAAWAALVITYGGVDTAASVTQSVTLPTTGASGTSVSWSTTGYISNVGTLVTRGINTDVSVTLTATISKGSRSRTKEFVLTVIRYPADVPNNWTVTPAGPLEMWVAGGQQEIRVRLTDWRGTYVSGRQVNFSTSLGVSDWYQPTGWIQNNSCNILTDSDGFAVTFFHPLNTGIGAAIWVSVPTGFGGNYLGPLTITVNAH